MYPSCVFEDSSIINQLDEKVTFFLRKDTVMLVTEGGKGYNNNVLTFREIT